MSNHLEDRLGRVLHDRADAVGGAPLTIDDVRRTAGTIRRRRRAAVAGAALAALAVLVPVGLEVADTPDRVVQPAPAPDREPAGTFPLGLDGLTAGEPPAVPYVVYDDRTLVTPQGEVPLETVFEQVVPYGDGYLALAQATDPGQVGFRLQRLDAEHRPVDDLGPVTDRIVAAPDGSAVAWVEPTDAGTSLVVAEEGTEPTRWPLDAAYAVPVGFVADGVVVATGEPPQTHLVVNAGGSRPLEGLQYAWDSSPATDLVVGQTDYRSATDTQCSGARDAATGELLWERCGLVVGDLSADGTLVLAFGTPLLPNAPSISVLDARTGETLVELAGGRDTDGPTAAVADATWEDADTALALVEQDGQQALVRLSTDGARELATAPVPTPGMQRELRFVRRPLGAVG